MQSLTLPRRASVKGLGKTLNIAIPVAIAALAASAAYAGADTTFTPALTKFTYIVCSLYVLTRFGYTRDREMTMRAILVASFAITSATSARAQDLSAPAIIEAPASHSEGIRIAETSNGFQLVEHGLWRSTRDGPASVLTVPHNGRVNLPYRYEPETKRGPSDFRRASYLPHIYAAEAKYSLPAGLLDALVWTESRYNPLAVSPAGAVGLGQLMPATAKELGVSNRFDPMANIFGAARYLRQMLDRFGVVHLAVAAYNAGPGAVERAGGIPRNGETPGYVRNVLQSWRF